DEAPKQQKEDIAVNQAPPDEEDLLWKYPYLEQWFIHTHGWDWRCISYLRDVMRNLSKEDRIILHQLNNYLWYHNVYLKKAYPILVNETSFWRDYPHLRGHMLRGFVGQVAMMAKEERKFYPRRTVASYSVGSQGTLDEALVKKIREGVIAKNKCSNDYKQGRKFVSVDLDGGMFVYDKQGVYVIGFVYDGLFYLAKDLADLLSRKDESLLYELLRFGENIENPTVVAEQSRNLTAKVFGKVLYSCFDELAGNSKRGFDHCFSVIKPRIESLVPLAAVPSNHSDRPIEIKLINKAIKFQQTLIEAAHQGKRTYLSHYVPWGLMTTTADLESQIKSLRPSTLFQILPLLPQEEFDVFRALISELALAEQLQWIDLIRQGRVERDRLRALEFWQRYKFKLLMELSLNLFGLLKTLDLQGFLNQISEFYQEDFKMQDTLSFDIYHLLDNSRKLCIDYQERPASWLKTSQGRAYRKAMESLGPQVCFIPSIREAWPQDIIAHVDADLTTAIAPALEREEFFDNESGFSLYKPSVSGWQFYVLPT
ncbi:MAG: hypothetical protein WCH62_09335, partial [Candidatus Omnitrophota bacterium]